MIRHTGLETSWYTHFPPPWILFLVRCFHRSNTKTLNERFPSRNTTIKLSRETPWSLQCMYVTETIRVVERKSIIDIATCHSVQVGYSVPVFHPSSISIEVRVTMSHMESFGGDRPSLKWWTTKSVVPNLVVFTYRSGMTHYTYRLSCEVNVVPFSTTNYSSH